MASGTLPEGSAASDTEAADQSCDCGHPGCNPNRLLPKLSPAQPIEMPLSLRATPTQHSFHDSTDSSTTQQAKRQPLVPLLLDEQTKTVPVDSPTDVHLAHQNQRTDAGQAIHSNQLLASLPLDSVDSNSIGRESPRRSTGNLAHHSNGLNTRLSDPFADSTAPVTIEPKPFPIDPAASDSRRRSAQSRNVGIPVAGSAMEPIDSEIRWAASESNSSFADHPPIAEQKGVNTETIESKIDEAAGQITAQSIGIKVDQSQFEIPPSKKVQPLKQQPPTGQSNDFQPTATVQQPATPTKKLKTEPAPLMATTPVASRIEDLTDEQLDSMFSLSNDEPILRPACRQCGNKKCDGKCIDRNQFVATPISTQVSGTAISLTDGKKTSENPGDETIAQVSHTEVHAAASRVSSTATTIAKFEVTHGAFCTEILGFGQITRFLDARFSSNQQLLIYCEAENYQSRKMDTNAGSQFVTRLKGRYRILDQQGKSVQSGDFPEVEDVSNRQRRDFFLYFPVLLNDLPSGNYRLELQVEDLAKHQTSTLDPELIFSVIN
jgi:hypothetical protein